MIITDEMIEELSQQLMDVANGISESSEEVIDQLFSIMDEVLSQQNLDTEALAKGAIFIVGTTGAGKSTLLNYLAGKELLVYSDMGVIKLKLKNPEDGISSIGTGTGQSETLYPIVYSDLETDITYVDNPGDEDSRGIAQQILNSYLKYNVAKELSKIQMLIVASQSSIINDNATTFVSYLNRFESIFVNSELINKNVSLVITRADMSYNDMKLNLENVLKYQETNLGAAKPILENIINNRRFGLFLQPTRDQVDQVYVSPIDEYGVGMEGIISMLKDTNYAITPGKDLFKPVVSDTETIRRILDNDESTEKRLSYEIISSIKEEFLKRVLNGNVEGFYETYNNHPIIKEGVASRQELIDFFRDNFNKDLTKNSDFKRIDFFHIILGEDTYKISLGTLNFKLDELKITDLINIKASSYDDVSQTLVAKGFSVSTSFVLTQLQDCSVDLKQIEIQALSEVVFDADLISTPGKNVSIIAPKWVIISPSKEIKLSGRDGLNHSENKAPNGKDGANGPNVSEGNGKNGGPGGHGADGAPGNNGSNGGSFFGFLNNVVTSQNILKIISNGGNGSRGQDGGNGGKGGNGSDGTKSPGLTFGGSGGIGGNGGKAGEGGKGGFSGTVEFNIKSESIIIDSVSGINGTNGASGIYGLGGKHGIGYRLVSEPGAGGLPNIHFEPIGGNPPTADNGSTPSKLNPSKPAQPTVSIANGSKNNYETFLKSFLGNSDISKDVASALLETFLQQ